MNQKRIMFIAPGHQIFDERVLRTINIAKHFGHCYYVLNKEHYEEIHNAEKEILSETVDHIGQDVKILSLPSYACRKTRFIVLFTRYTYAVKIARQVHQISPQIVHIHESGSFGLLIAFFIRKFNPSCKIIFDYHDWIPYEVATICRNRAILYKLVLPLHLIFYRQLAKSVDVAVGISPGHAQWARKELRISHTVVVQNVRPYLPPVAFPPEEKRRQLFFAGNIMRIRRIELAIDILAELKCQFVEASLVICGYVKDPVYKEELLKYAEEKGMKSQVRFYGRYKSDEELRKFATGTSIGISFGLNPSLDTGIEKISSGNKFFTYLTLGLPVLIENGLDNMIEIAERNGAGYSFRSVKDFVLRARKIWETKGLWDQMSKNAFSIAKEMNSESYTPLLKSLYQ